MSASPVVTRIDRNSGHHSASANGENGSTEAGHSVPPLETVTPAENAVSPPAAPVTPSLKKRAISGSAWTMVEYGATQAMRFAGVIILTRLLAREDFALMTMVSVFLIGLEMFSDIGIAPNIIRHKRGDDPAFLNTAWTMQVGRGFLLWFIACAAAWPVAVFFGEPLLVLLICVVGFTSVIGGFCSTSVIWLNRKLEFRKITYLGIATQVVNYATIIIWAFFSPDVWALVAGGFTSNIFYVVASHFLVRGHRNYLHWNRHDAWEIFKFGRWIFGSTGLTFAATQSDRIMGGRFLPLAMFGVYGLAAQVAFLIPQLVKKLAYHVTFPVLSEINRERADEFHYQLRRLRLAVIGLAFLAMVPLLIIAKPLIAFLLPPEWVDAGWMLQILTAGAFAGIVNITYGNALLAQGKSFQMMLLLGMQLVFLLTGGIIGAFYFGEIGFVVGVACAEWLNYPATAIVMMRERLWQPEVDGPALLTALAAIVLVFVLL